MMRIGAITPVQSSETCIDSPEASNCDCIDQNSSTALTPKYTYSAITAPFRAEALRRPIKTANTGRSTRNARFNTTPAPAATRSTTPSSASSMPSANLMIPNDPSATAALQIPVANPTQSRITAVSVTPGIRGGPGGSP